MTLVAASQIASSGDANSELARLKSLVAASKLPAMTQAALAEQLESTLGTFGRQLSSQPRSMIKASRVLEGEGYRIVIRVGPKSAGFLAGLKQRLGW